MALSFKKQFSIKDPNVEFVDIPVDSKDLEAFICPFLIESNKTDKVVSKVSKRLRNFLTELNTTYIKPNDFKNGIPFIDHLHEPNEYHLGYSDSNKGKAVSNSKAQQIFQFLRNNKFARQGVSITNEAHNVLLLVDGIGQDIMSDIIANVCRDIFADFTVTICNKYSVKSINTEIEYYNDTTKKWQRKKIDLPVYTKHIILIPHKLVSGGRAYSNLYNWYVSSNYISKEILNQKKPPKGTVSQMKDGTRKAIIKEIYKQYRKPKKDLIDFVLKYPNSLDEFIAYAKTHYPELKIDHLKK
ncbi:hypothetical protein [Sediminibacterium sp.]|uniref:hypothetical protein n=1 Tax=Sediminibacterium sp. TaxID=1917865 RepID=UPI002736B450|nr:hypothetical protein [Sediminibacterium sp.]MDP3394225.1 hypothetical protein [Sediminibacterium sp.]MDP3567085.1 hypothetical protein [Sediminibacterium sp.]